MVLFEFSEFARCVVVAICSHTLRGTGLVLAKIDFAFPLDFRLRGNDGAVAALESEAL